jgi:hypothetical protein
MLKLEFTGNSADEVNAQVKDYASKIKGSRGGKGDKDEDAGTQQATNVPPPAQPPVQQFQPGSPAMGFPGAPPAPGAAPGPGFPAPAAGPSPEVAALAQRIGTRLDGAIASGQPADAALTWLRGQLGAEAANADMNQCKTLLLKAPQPVLENIAKLMNA